MRGSFFSFRAIRPITIGFILSAISEGVFSGKKSYYIYEQSDIWGKNYLLRVFSILSWLSLDLLNDTLFRHGIR